jgi:hypothetical protein
MLPMICRFVVRSYIALRGQRVRHDDTSLTIRPSEVNIGGYPPHSYCGR